MLNIASVNLDFNKKQHMINLFLIRPKCDDRDETTFPPNTRQFNSPVRLRTLPDKMATSNGGGMEVDGAGKYFSFILQFVYNFYLNLCTYCSKLCVFTFGWLPLLTLYRIR